MIRQQDQRIRFWRRTSDSLRPAPWSWACLLLALATCFGIGLARPSLPGLQFDEAADAVPAIELMLGQPPSSISSITLFGRQWPLMMLHHIGPTSIYISFLGLSAFGISVEALRLTQLILGAITLALLWWMARSWFDDLTAAMAVLACATAPAYVWWSRAGLNWTLPLLPLALGLLMALRRWWRTRHPAWLILAAFLFGAGVTTKILFIWLAAPIALTAWLGLGLRRSWAAIRSTSPGAWVLAILALAAGLLPLILHNLPSGDTIQFILGNAAQTRIYGHNNLDVWNNLIIVTSEFLRMMGGDTLHFQAPAGLPLGALALAASLAYAIAVAIRRRVKPPADDWDTRRLFLALTVVAVLPLSTVSTSGIGATYLFLIVPLAWLLIAVSARNAVAGLAGRFGRRAGAAAGLASVLLLCASQVATNVQIVRFFDATGGKGLWSDAIYRLAALAEGRYAGRPLMAMDWGFARNLAFLTLNHTRVQMKEMYEMRPAPSPQYEDTASVLLRDPANVYVFHAPASTAFGGQWEVFERTAQKMHKQLTLDAALPEGDGAPNTLVYTATDAPPQFAVSLTLATRNARFDQALTLLGGAVAYDPARNEVAVRLYWRADAANLPDDTVLVHIVDQSNGQVVLAADQQPLYGNYPFPRWQAGEVVEDPRWVSLPPGLAPGIYQVRIGVYHTATGERRAIADPLNDAAGNSLMLATFEVSHIQ